MAPCSCTDCSATKRAHLPIFALAPEAARLRATGSASSIERRAQRHRARLVALHRHVGEAVTDHLVGGQRPSELLSDLGVFQRLVEQHLHDADSLRAKRGHRAIDHGLNRGQRVAAVAEQRVSGKVHIAKIEVAGAAAAETREVARGEPGCLARHEEQAELAVIDARRDDDLPCGVAVEHGGLLPIETPAIGRFPG